MLLKVQISCQTKNKMNTFCLDTLCYLSSTVKVYLDFNIGTSVWCLMLIKYFSQRLWQTSSVTYRLPVQLNLY